MGTTKPIKWMNIFLGIIGLIIFCSTYIVLNLFVVPVTPVEYQPPPNLVLQGEPSASAVAVGEGVGVDEAELPPAAPMPSDPDDSDIETLAKGVFFDGESSEYFAARFGHPDQEVREAAARALARCFAANGGMIEPRAEGAEQLRRREIMESFLANADKPTILKALLEVTSKSVETGGSEFQGDDDLVLFLLAWFPGMDTQRAETLAWVANHHPSDAMRRSAVFFVAANDSLPREIGDEVLESRAHDPSPWVRFEVIMQRMDRIF